MKTVEMKHSVTPQKELKSQIYRFMKTHPVGVVASVDPNGSPHAAAVYYTVEPSLTIRFLTKKDTKKSDNLRHHTKAHFVVFDDESQTTVQIQARAKLIDGEQAVHEMFMATLRGSLQTSKSAVPPISKLAAGEYVVFELKPVDVRMASYRRAKSGDYRQVFEQL